MPTKQPVPPPKNKFDAAYDFERGVIFALFRRGKLEEGNPIWMDGYKFAAGMKESVIAAKNASLERNGFQPIGLITAQQPTSPPPPKKK